jgi:hypothetical protein
LAKRRGLPQSKKNKQSVTLCFRPNNLTALVTKNCRLGYDFTEWLGDNWTEKHNYPTRTGFYMTYNKIKPYFVWEVKAINTKRTAFTKEISTLFDTLVPVQRKYLQSGRSRNIDVTKTRKEWCYDRKEGSLP